MPDIVQNVIVDFQVDYSQLTGAQEQLAKSGKIDDKGFKVIQQAIDTTATDTKGLIKTFKDVATASTKMGKSVEDAFGAGIQDALDEAGVSVEQFNSALKKANAPATSLKKELLQLREAMARMKAAGQDTGKEFDTLRKKAGALSDAIADTNAEIKNAGSDTRGLDNVVGSISAIAGGYAAVQGAAALFGDENEDLQKTLVKVNAAMALAQGLQVLYTATLKEGALAKLADSVSTGAQSAATTLYTFVVGGATVATRIFRAALIATGIGAIVVLVLSLVSAMSDFGGESEDAAKAQSDLKNALDFTNTSLENQLTALGNLKAEADALAKLEGKSLKDQYAQRKLFADREIDILKDKQKAAQNFAFDQEDLADKGMATQEDVTAAYKAWGDATIAVNNAVSKSTVDYLNEQIRVKDESKKINEDLGKKRLEALEKARKKELALIAETVAANLKKDHDIQEQEEINYNNLSDITEQGRADKEAINAKWDALRLEMQKSFIKSSETAAAKMKADEEAKRAELIKTVNLTVEVATRIANVFNLISSLRTEKDQQEIASRRKNIDEQLKAGVITEKAAAARQKQLDIFEKNARYRQAQREKQAAMFTAALAIPKAYLAGLSIGGPTAPVWAALFAALAAAEFALIASKPVPRFFKGKKDSYQGPGVVGDMGSEIVERNGRMFLYTQPTQTYLGARDKVYTAAETRNIMHNTGLKTDAAKPHADRFDYDRFAKSIPKDSININIDKDFISESVGRGLMRTNYMDRRYNSKR